MEPNGEKKFIDPAKKPVTAADKWTLFLGLLGAIKILLAADPINIEIPQATFDAFVNFLGALLAVIAMIRNNRRYKNTGGYIETEHKTYIGGPNKF
jgi:hypothetical protein